VPNIAGRADLLAVAAIFGCLLLHRRPPRPVSVLLFFVVALLGALSKETALLLPALLPLFDALEGKSLVARLRQKLPYDMSSIAAALCMLAARHAVLQQRPWPIPPYFDNPLFSAGFWTARLTAIKVLGLDLLLLAFPWNLSCDRSFNEIRLSTAGDP